MACLAAPRLTFKCHTAVQRVQHNNRIPRVTVSSLHLALCFCGNDEISRETRRRRGEGKGVGFSSRREENDRLTNRYPDSKRSSSSSTCRPDNRPDNICSSSRLSDGLFRSLPLQIEPLVLQSTLRCAEGFLRCT